MAHALLSVEDDAEGLINYFGALTYTVQLYRNSETEAQQAVLLEGNLVHFARLLGTYLSAPDKRFLQVLRKLMSNLARLFIKVNQKPAGGGEPAWENPVHTILFLLHAYRDGGRAGWQLGDAQLSETVRASLHVQISYEELIGLLDKSPELNRQMLLYVRVLAEDLTSEQSRRSPLHDVNALVRKHLYITAMAMINHTLEQSMLPENCLRAAAETVAFEAITAWVEYVSLVRTNSQDYMDLTDLFEHLIKLMCISHEGRFPFADRVIGMLSSVLSHHPELMNVDLRVQLESIFLGVTRSDDQQVSRQNHEWMLLYMNHLVAAGAYDGLSNLATCVVGFLNLNILDISSRLFTRAHNDTSQIQQYIKVLLQLTNFPAAPVLQEEYSVNMTTFWQDLCDSYYGLSADILRPDGPAIAEDVFGQLVDIYLPKVSLINKLKIIDGTAGDAELRRGSISKFEYFRNEVATLVAQSWMLLGNSKLTNQLILKVCEQQRQSGSVDLFQVECMAFLLERLLEGVDLEETPELCDLIRESELMEYIMYLLNAGCKQHMHTEGLEKLKLHFVDTGSALLRNLLTYFKVNQDSLIHVVGNIFSCMAECSRFNSPQDTSDIESSLMQTFTALCNQCRHEMVPLFPSLLGIMEQMLSPASNTSKAVRRDMVRSVSFIIQAGSSQDPISLGKDINNMLDLFCATTDANDKQSTNALLTYILELGQGLKDCSGGGIDVARHKVLEEHVVADLQQIHDKVLSVIYAGCKQHRGDADLIETSCLILGLNVQSKPPHLFRFTVPQILDFLFAQLALCNLAACLPHMVRLLERLLIHQLDAFSQEQFDHLLSKFFVQHYALIAEDPDLIHSMGTFLVTALQKKPAFVLYSAHLHSFMLPRFLDYISAQESFTIRAAVRFWSLFLKNRYLPDDRAAVSACMSLIGPQLVANTMRALYHVRRSEINSYTDVLRALVASYPLQTKAWLSATMPTLDGRPEVHARFIESILVTRGSHAASRVVQTWWLECNGLPRMD
ncbi:AaceriAGR166Wp [[Ashbya] aceris (nom. inval.)]|nr:AaceriAGR166Wp [[Ashbya] aceris (nom. inval.)]